MIEASLLNRWTKFCAVLLATSMVAIGTIAKSAQASVVLQGTLTDFSDGDDDAQVDLSGTFAYALDGGPSSDGNLTIRNAVFTESGSTPGVTLTGAYAGYSPSNAVPFNYGLQRRQHA